MALKSNPVIFVVGSTATGKSEWALQMAERSGGVIVNCDSIQVYREVEIGTAKPTPAERQRVPHYLIDYVSPPDEMTAGKYTRDFFEQMTVFAENQPVFVVGGTGFYFQAIEKGMYPVAQIPPEIQADIDRTLQEPGGPERLFQELTERDPLAGKKIHPADHYRIARAVEMMRVHGKTLSEIRNEFSQRKSDFPYPLLKVGVQWDRERLRGRIELRTRKMIEAGLIDEVKRLRAKDLEDWAPLSSVGYAEVMGVLDGVLERGELEEKISQATYQLSKRQKTWFQRDAEIHWFDGSSQYDRAQELVDGFLRDKKDYLQ